METKVGQNLYNQGVVYSPLCPFCDCQNLYSQGVVYSPLCPFCDCLSKNWEKGVCVCARVRVRVCERERERDSLGVLGILWFHIGVDQDQGVHTLL